jgi:hypothetical protein
MYCISYHYLSFYIRIYSESFFKLDNGIAAYITSFSSYNSKRIDLTQTRTLLDIQFILMASGAFIPRIVKSVTTIVTEQERKFGLLKIIVIAFINIR